MVSLRAFCEANNREYLLDEWDYDNNGSYTPDNVSYGSGKRIRWICRNCGHTWEAQVCSRTAPRKIHGCPKCGVDLQRKNRASNTVEAGLSFADRYPELALEWDYDKNEGVLPSQITGSEKKYWWVCPKGHEYLASPRYRIAGHGCNICSKERGTSFAEQAIYYYLSKVYKCENRFLFDGKEIDIYIPELKIGIEYDGIYYHSSKSALEKEKRKNTFLENRNVRLIRVKESKDRNSVEGDTVYLIPTHKDLNLGFAVSKVFELIGTSVELIPVINIDDDRSLIYSSYLQLEKENSISVKNPDLLLDWNKEKNGKLNPDYFSYSSEKRIWWKCRFCGYEWQATVASRSAGNGCAACAGQVVIVGKNDLASCVPELLSEWDYEKNMDFSPTQVTVRSNKKVWWKCSICGNEWKAAINNRARGLSLKGCPDCARKRMQEERDEAYRKKVGSLAQNHPELLEEWDYEKNEIDPDSVTSRSGKKAYWICKTCGYKWCTPISNRTAGHGCRICSARAGALRRYASKRVTD